MLTTNILDQIDKSRTQLKILMNIDRLFDESGLYVYKGWLDSVILDGPIVTRYWVALKLLYPSSDMEDFERSKHILDRLRIRVSMEKTPIVHYDSDFSPNEVKSDLYDISKSQFDDIPEPSTEYGNVIYLLVPKKIVLTTDELDEVDTSETGEGKGGAEVQGFEFSSI